MSNPTNKPTIDSPYITNPLTAEDFRKITSDARQKQGKEFRDMANIVAVQILQEAKKEAEKGESSYNGHLVLDPQTLATVTKDVDKSLEFIEEVFLGRSFNITLRWVADEISPDVRRLDHPPKPYLDFHISWDLGD